VDGDATSCAQTDWWAAGGAAEWWQVDLGAAQWVDHVAVAHRAELPAAAVVVFVSATPDYTTPGATRARSHCRLYHRSSSLYQIC
jgi:hypothetical protein